MITLSVLVALQQRMHLIGHAQRTSPSQSVKKFGIFQTRGHNKNTKAFL